MSDYLCSTECVEILEPPSGGSAAVPIGLGAVGVGLGIATIGQSVNPPATHNVPLSEDAIIVPVFLFGMAAIIWRKRYVK